MGQMRLPMWSTICKRFPLSFELKLHSYQQAPGAWPLISLTSSITPHLSATATYGAPATLASLTLIKLCKYPPSLSSLRCLLSQPGMLFPQIFTWSASSYTSSSVRKYHFQKPTSEKLFKIAKPPHPGLRDPMNCFSPPCFITLITH